MLEQCKTISNIQTELICSIWSQDTYFIIDYESVREKKRERRITLEGQIHLVWWIREIHFLFLIFLIEGVCIYFFFFFPNGNLQLQ